MKSATCLLFAACALAHVGYSIDGTWIGPASGGSWTDTANWENGNIPDGGGTAYLPVGIGNISLADASSRVGAIVHQGVGDSFKLLNGTLTLVNPGKISSTQKGGVLDLQANTVNAEGRLTVTGEGRVQLGAPQTIAGKIVVTEGWLRVADDTAMGPTPAALVADAITLDDGGLQNGKSNSNTVIAPTRGIYVTERGGGFSAGYIGGGLLLGGPVTGPGTVSFNYENSPVLVANPGNDWWGDTIVGGMARSYHNGYNCTVILNADEVIPHGAGRGILRLSPFARECNSANVGAQDATLAPQLSYRSMRTARSAYLDLNGHTETVNALAGDVRSTLLSTNGPGRLVLAGDADSYMRGVFEKGVTVAKYGAGTFDVRHGPVNAGATIELNAGTLNLYPGNAATGSRVVYNGGTLNFTPYTGFSVTTFSNGNPVPGGVAAIPLVGSFPGLQYAQHALYRAKWVLPEARTYSFLKSFSGRGALRIDGATIIDDSDVNNGKMEKNIALEAGEHALEVEFEVAANQPAGALFNGIMYDPENGDFATEAEKDRARYFSTDFDEDLLSVQDACVMNGALHLTADCTLTVDPALGTCQFAGGVDAENGAKLTVVSDGPAIFGSTDASRPSVVAAVIESAHGVILTNNVWVAAPVPPNVTVAPGTLVTYGYEGALADGLTLKDCSAGVSHENAGDGTIVVHTGQTFRFGTSAVVNGVATDDAANGRTYANNVVLAGGTLEFGGMGTITYTGTITGAGLVTKTGSGTVNFNGDATALTAETRVRCDDGAFLVRASGRLGAAIVRTNGGRFGVQAGCDVTFGTETKFEGNSGGFFVGEGARCTINGFIEGILGNSKWGNGVLAIAGEGVDNTVSLHVRGGTVELAKSGDVAAVKGIQGIEVGAVVRITGDSTKMIPRVGYVNLDGGTFDLNGHDLAVAEVSDSGSNVSLTKSVVVNNGTQAATLTVDGAVDITYSGSFAAGASDLTVRKAGGSTWTLKGTLANTAFAVDAGKAQVIGQGALKTRYVRFTGIASRPAGAYQNTGMQFSEIRFLLNGAEVALPAGRTATAEMPADGGNESAAKIVDGTVDTKWYCNQLAKVLTTIDLGGEVMFNGYQLATANDAEGRDPYSWKIEVSDDGQTWKEVGRETAVELTMTRKTWDQHVFAVEGMAGLFAPDMTVTVAEGATLGLSKVGETFEHLTCAGALELDGAEAVVTGASGITGSATGAGTVRLATTEGQVVAFDTEAGVTVVADTMDKKIGVPANKTRTMQGNLGDGTNKLGVEVDAAGATLLLAGTNNAYTGGTKVNRGTLLVRDGIAARFFRFTIDKVQQGSAAQLSDINLFYGGTKLVWPEGSSATTTGANAAGNEGPEMLLDGSTSTKCFWSGGANPVVITCPQAVVFTGYDWWTANDSMAPAGGKGRQPVSWRFEYSNDGVNWTVFDEQVDNPDTPNAQNLGLAYAMLPPPSAGNAVPDADPVEMGADGVFEVSGIAEAVGGVSGEAGAVQVLADGTLTLAPTDEVAYAGSVSGAGTLVMAGAGRQTLSGAINLAGTIVVEDGVLDLDGATLTGVTNIVLKGGALVGAATVSGDLAVSNEGGAYGAELAVSGRLALTGEMKLTVDFAGRPVRRTAFTYASSDQASIAVFRDAALLDDLVGGWKCTNSIANNHMVVSVAPSGTVFYVR